VILFPDVIREDVMPAVPLNEGMTAAEFRAAAAAAKDANQARRLLALAAVRDGMKREDAARIGGMDRQTLRDWVHAFNASGIEGLINGRAPGRVPKLSATQKAEIKEIVLKGPDPEKDGVVRWRRIDLVRIAKARFNVSVDEDTMGRVLRELGFSHISARPKYPAQPDDAVVSFQKRSQKN
jgi:transposase